MQFPVRNSQGSIIGFRCTTCNWCISFYVGGTCNKCRAEYEALEENRKLRNEIKELKEQLLKDE